jgi:magnesium-transporting ATPase (P-type)
MDQNHQNSFDLNNRVMRISNGKIMSKTPISSSSKKSKVPSNRIHSTKYSFYNFLFLAIWYEMNKFTNIYFFITMIIQSIPSISTLNPMTIIIPFFSILLVGLIREAIEDLYRFTKDRKINNSIARVYCPDKQVIVLKKWSKIREGDFVLMIEDEETPADMLLINCKSSTSNAYIETSNLDGEKNLKCKHPIRPYIDNKCFSKPDIKNLEIFYPKPISDIYFFEGYCIDDSIKTNLSKNNFIPRGVFLRNTEYLLGLVIYVGKETKIVLNNKQKKNKISSTEKIMNNYVFILVIFEFILLIIIAIISTLNIIYYSDILQWWGFDDVNLFSNFFVIMLSYFILMNSFLPISLIISIESIRLIQILFFKFDEEFKYNDQYMMVNTMTLNEELGKIEYVLSDKTGTLTKNIMTARQFIAGFNDFALFDLNHSELTDKKKTKHFKGIYSYKQPRSKENIPSNNEIDSKTELNTESISLSISKPIFLV